MNSEQLAVLILGIAGVILQLVFRYVPAVKAWYEKQANKGPLMLGFVVLVSGAYYGLACSPYAEMLKIAISCTTGSIFELLKAIFIVATGNQLAYLYNRKGRSR